MANENQNIIGAGQDTARPAPKTKYPAILDVTMGHRGMQKEIRERFGIDGPILSMDIRPKMGNGMVPDMVMDSRAMTFADNLFDIVLFDPPFSFHGAKSCGNADYNRFYVTYGLNLYTSRSELGDYISKTFAEIFRVLRSGGTCLMKWSESRIKLEFPLSLSGKLVETRRWKRPSKHWGTKTGTATWYVWFNKPVLGEESPAQDIKEICHTAPNSAMLQGLKPHAGGTGTSA